MEFGKDYKAKRRIIVKSDETGEETEYLIQKGKHIEVIVRQMLQKVEIMDRATPPS